LPLVLRSLLLPNPKPKGMSRKNLRERATAPRACVCLSLSIRAPGFASTAFLSRDMRAMAALILFVLVGLNRDSLTAAGRFLRSRD
jgi:hypothetical protein